MSLNVLVVDDSAVSRAMIIKSLRLSGADLNEIHQAGNGQEGLSAMEQHWIDLVLVDINMPIMTGEEMIDSLRANPAWSDLPVIVVSTEGSQTRIERLEQKGAMFIHKPFSPEGIRDVIRQVLGAVHE